MLACVPTHSPLALRFSQLRSSIIFYGRFSVHANQSPDFADFVRGDSRTRFLKTEKSGGQEALKVADLPSRNHSPFSPRLVRTDAAKRYVQERCGNAKGSGNQWSSRALFLLNGGGAGNRTPLLRKRPVSLYVRSTRLNLSPSGWWRTHTPLEAAVC